MVKPKPLMDLFNRAAEELHGDAFLHWVCFAYGYLQTKIPNPDAATLSALEMRIEREKKDPPRNPPLREVWAALDVPPIDEG